MRTGDVLFATPVHAWWEALRSKQEFNYIGSLLNRHYVFGHQFYNHILTLLRSLSPRRRDSDHHSEPARAMKLSLAVTAGSLATRTVAGAYAGSGVVQWDIQKRPSPPQAKPRFQKRASTYEEVVSNEETRGGYFANCKMGTPAQDMTLQLDTGSSDIWVPESNAKVCRKKDGCPLGSCRALPTVCWSRVGLLTKGFQSTRAIRAPIPWLGQANLTSSI